MIYHDRFCVFFKSLYLNPGRTTYQDRKNGNWKINISNEDLTIVKTFWRNNVDVESGDQGRLPLSYEVANDFRKVDKTPWKRKIWVKKNNWESGIATFDMGYHGNNISVRTDSDMTYGLIGNEINLKVTFRGGPDMPSEVIGYGSIDVRRMMTHFKSYRENSYQNDSISYDVDLPKGFGHMVFEASPVVRPHRHIRKRAVARGSGLSPYVIQKLAKKKLPDCCIKNLKLLLRCLKTHQTVLKAWDTVEWGQKVLDPKWITETAKKVRGEAYQKIKSELIPPKFPVDASLKGNTILLSSLILSNTLVTISFDHMIDHQRQGGLEDIWNDIYQNFNMFREEMIKKAGGEKLLKAKLSAAVLSQTW